VACPFFEPRQKRETGPWTHAPRLPLGAEFSGVCRSRPGEPHAPPEEHQRDLCNCGYARGRCSDFPADTEPDAVRFSWNAHLLVYILEKDHAPLRHGVLEVERAFSPATDELLLLQARAFVDGEKTLRK
jgi:hypothetical protein